MCLRSVNLCAFDVLRIGGGSETEECARTTQLKTHPRFKSIKSVPLRLILQTLVEESLTALSCIGNASIMIVF